MLTSKQSIDAGKHERAVGQRATGHFDRDATKHVGPTEYRAVKGVKPSKETSPHKKKVTLVRRVDERTGEVILSLEEPSDT